MSIFSLFITGIGLSMDAFAISLAKGFCIKDQASKKALKVSLFFGIAQGVMPLIGWFLGSYFENYIKSIDHWVAFILLCFIGGKMLYESFCGKEEEPLDCDIHGDDFKNKDLFVLAIATSIDALAVGVSFALLSVDIFQASSIIAILTGIICFIGVYLGKVFGNLFNKYAEILGGSLLIVMGIKILFEHIFLS